MSKIKIHLDAGHYGSRYNQGINKKYYESNFTWRLQELLKAELEKRGIEVTVSRNKKDDDPSLYNRGYGSKGCNLFLSLHSNACGTESVDRVAIYHLINDKKISIDEESKKVGDVLGKVIRDTMGVSKYTLNTKKSDNDRNKNGEMDDEYYGVLNGGKAAGTPSLILEHSFHTNRKACEWLMVDDNIKKLAVAEADALAKYYNVKAEDKKEEIKVNQWYRVRKSWADKKSQLGAYKVYNNAVKACKEGYSVFDDNGNILYTAGGKTAENDAEYIIYTVKKGDSLWKIAAKYLGNGAKYPEIKTLNNLKGNTVYVGQKLKIKK